MSVVAFYDVLIQSHKTLSMFVNVVDDLPEQQEEFEHIKSAFQTVDFLNADVKV